ncbi:hypothetical protein IMG5_205360 [Ichthyophthirius multifiliis]|uniref:Casein kinase I n=1 Tax=Ichthyophthirius multifiliis TaxID=5932 RepID=G0R6J4_ICHMU|nr:hypothetical protein IMG5_205360 [Ichthyophthirius multifiliis]EGR26911.1 hypothetical protein IMG5_205360 [Ichthyophthirius multifiliis]|eukprot:XP_004023795.1 hypothetical protein IMG5_205360 [Ichthyophthirius multifiliis]
MSIVEVRICGRYKLGQKISIGQYSSIYLARNVQTNVEVAIKIEEQNSKHQLLLKEGNIIQNLQGGTGVPYLNWFGQEGEYNFLVIELLGYNLEDLFNICGRKFSLKTVLMIADQLISNMEHIHFKSYVYRDVKPQNFCVGLSKKSRHIFTIDFGLSKKYKNPRTNEHNKFSNNKYLIGCIRYMSNYIHNKYEYSRRDDMLSLGYMFIYFLNGYLPWQGIQCVQTQELFKQIKEMKNNISYEELCSGLAPEFEVYMKYCKSLQYEEKPDYTYLKKIFKERFVKEGYQFDYVYDWILIPLRGKSRKQLNRQNGFYEQFSG